MQKIIKNLCFTICIVLQALFLVSCGGGGSSNGSGGTSGPNNSTGGELTVKMISPSDTANVPLNTPIELQFSEAVKNVTTSTVTLMESDPITGTQILTTPLTGVSDNTYVFYSKKYLSPNTKYYVVVGTGILSVSSNQSVAATNFTFTTGNFAAPIATLINPLNGDTGVSTSTNIQIQFNESVSNVNTSTVLLHESNSNSKPISMTMSDIVESNTYTFTPVSLKPGTLYYVEVTSGVASVATGAAVKDTTFSFTTSQTLKSPTVNILTPQNNAVVESLQPNMIVQFSESVNNLTNDSVVLHEGDPAGESVMVALVKALPNNTYEFKPDLPLKIGTVYYLEFTSEITSVNTGISLEPATFNFTVKSPGFLFAVGKDGLTVCPLDTLTGKASNCNVTTSGQGAVSVRTHPTTNMIYLVNKESDSISACTIDQTTGSVLACNDSAGFDKPVSIAINKDASYAYVLNSGGGKNVLVCLVTQTGDLQNCTPTVFALKAGESVPSTKPTSFSNPTSITLDPTNTFAYIADFNNNNITVCQVSSATQDLTNCGQFTSSNIKSTTALAISNDGKYMYSANDYSDIVVSNIDSIDGTLNGAIYAETSFTNLADLITNGEYLYVADSGNGAVSVCKPSSDANDEGKLDYCRYSAFNIHNISGISILNNN